MTNEEIKQAAGESVHLPAYYHVSVVDEMLDEARKDEAVEFGAWIVKRYTRIEVKRNQYLWWDGVVGGKYHTTEELYQCFKNR